MSFNQPTNEERERERERERVKEREKEREKESAHVNDQKSESAGGQTERWK